MRRSGQRPEGGAQATLTDFSQFKKVNWELLSKDARINMRLPAPLMAAVKKRAAERGIPYQRLIREAIEAALR
jgi:predicted DNA binding CopG/RHH family protein